MFCSTCRQTCCQGLVLYQQYIAAAANLMQARTTALPDLPALVSAVEFHTVPSMHRVLPAMYQSSSQLYAKQIKNLSDLPAVVEERIPDDLWVQCDFPQCLKWRKMPPGTHPDSLPENWFCYNHPDPIKANLSHSASEELYTVPVATEVCMHHIHFDISRCVHALCHNLTQKVAVL